jgi:putative pyruvate formate lyase activating enzyme
MYYSSYEYCQLCPRNCRVNRAAGEKGICGETADLRIAAIEPHFGEEPPISGSNGSGTVFFSGCSLRCKFCQNYQISLQQKGTGSSADKAADELANLVNSRHIHNINFVTPDHFLLHTIQIVNRLEQLGIDIPVLYNNSGYCRIEALQLVEDVADMYLPDFKYADQVLAGKLANCRNYSEVALPAIAEMVKQKGFLDSFLEDKSIATKGVLVRHLVLPGQVQNSIDALSMLFLEFGRHLPISLMSQYWPTHQFDLEGLNRKLQPDEFDRVYQHALDLGFDHLFVQHPQEQIADDFLPDFNNKRPFKGNK